MAIATLAVVRNPKAGYAVVELASVGIGVGSALKDFGTVGNTSQLLYSTAGGRSISPNGDITPVPTSDFDMVLWDIADGFHKPITFTVQQPGSAVRAATYNPPAGYSVVELNSVVTGADSAFKDFGVVGNTSQILHLDSIGTIAANGVVTPTPTADFDFLLWDIADGLRKPLTYTFDDTVPNSFSFTDLTGVALSTVTESSVETIAGLGAPSAISISGGEYRIDGGTYTSTPGTINNNQTVQLRVTSSGSETTDTNVPLTIGGVVDTWTVTTLQSAAVRTIPVAYDPPVGWEVQEITNGVIAQGYVFENFTGPILDTSQVLYQPPDTVGADGLYSTSATTDRNLLFWDASDGVRKPFVVTIPPLSLTFESVTTSSSNATGNLAIGVILAASLTAQTVLTANLGFGYSFAGDANSQNTVTADLGAGITLGGAALSSFISSANLMNGDVFQGVGTSSFTSTANLLVAAENALFGNAFSNMTVVGELRQAPILGGVGISGSTLLGDLFVVGIPNPNGIHITMNKGAFRRLKPIRIVTGDDISFVVALQNNKLPITIPTSATVKARIITRYTKSIIVDTVETVAATIGADWVNGTVVLIFPNLTPLRMGRSTLEIQVEDSGKTTWFYPLRIIEGTII